MGAKEIENDVREVKWAFDLFQRKCVPSRYRVNMDVIIARYYMNHPSKETVNGIVSETEEKMKNKFYEFLSKNRKVVWDCFNGKEKFDIRLWKQTN